ncbi:cytochrome P450 [Actinomadura rudentiformis]|uniref:Cytochrome P450 n=1 Tax=Actinomadura rudentiformis TaxID=359158 RepID=A0A6H9YUU9_9ACTN|nr:cytochrome P450 [Actinomadura rudentiformis]KAB2348345.1 cytochrome P450 [Actinomadura rudentiformis]
MLIKAGSAGAFIAAVVSLPWWLPGRIVALRVRVFARINGDAAITVPGDLVGVEQFKELYSHPAAGGRSKGAALSDLFWYWLSPGAEVHQEHLEAGERYDAVAKATRAFLAVRRREAEDLTRRCVASEVRAGRELVRLRDLMMPVWAAFYYELVFGRPCPPEARDLIVGNANDVVTALKCCGLRHMDKRHRLTAYLAERLDEVRCPLPEGLSAREQVFYLQGTFFNTAVVQMSEAMAHLLMVFAQRPELQDKVRADDDDHYLDQVIAETLRLYPLFGIAHRVTTDDIELTGTGVRIPEGSVVCFDYPRIHREGFTDPDRFDPDRWSSVRTSGRDVNHIPFGVAANRPCPAWRMAPITMRVAAREILRRYVLTTSASHTRSLPNRGPALLIPRDGQVSAARPTLLYRPALMLMRLRDRWEDVWRSLVQLVLGTAMVLHARRLRLCERHFSGTSGAEIPHAPTCPGRREQR